MGLCTSKDFNTNLRQSSPIIDFKIDGVETRDYIDQKIDESKVSRYPIYRVKSSSKISIKFFRLVITFAVHYKSS